MAQDSNQSLPQAHYVRAPKLPTGEVEPKIYHSRFPGSTFVRRDGTVESFDHTGALTAKDAELQYELDKIADKGGSPVYTKDAPVMTQSDRQPVVDLQARAAKVVEAMKAAQNAQQGG